MHLELRFLHDLCLFYEGHGMLKSLTGKKNTTQNPKLVWRKEQRWGLLPARAFTD